MNDIMSDKLVEAIKDIKQLINDGDDRIIERIRSIDGKIDTFSDKQSDMSTRLKIAEIEIAKNTNGLNKNWDETRLYDTKLSSLEKTQDGKINVISNKIYIATGAILIIAGVLSLGIVKLT